MIFIHKIKTLEYSSGKLIILDQTKLPNKTEFIEIASIDEAYRAICSLSVRGAPAIGVFAAYSLVIGAKANLHLPITDFMHALKKDAVFIASSRPTAVNLTWAINRMLKKLESTNVYDTSQAFSILEKEAMAIHQEDISINKQIGHNLLSLLNDGDTILTHCNAGILATSGYGTALSPVYLAKERGMNIKVYADETRPLLQGSRITAYELNKSGIDVTLICDNMAAVILSKKLVQAVIVGCDRVAANGDVANKIGTFSLSILANHFNIPVYIAAPTPTIDFNCTSGDGIPIEQRDALEVKKTNDTFTSPQEIKVFNPAFDVTPNNLISAIVTEKGIAYPPFNESLKSFR